jgi:hypothetical protein
MYVAESLAAFIGNLKMRYKRNTSPAQRAITALARTLIELVIVTVPVGG